MTEQQIQQLIFAPGFSTAEKVTAISGRGVGMDVVRTNIEKIGGTIDMRSALGRGTTFTIKIPLTLAIVSALIVEVDGDRYAVPQLSVRELVRLTNDGDARLEDIHGTPIMRLRERLLPLVCLRKVLQLGPPPADSDNIHGKQVIVAEAGGYQFGLIVDRVFDTEEIVVKPVSPILRRFRSFSGNTILGDGTVILILDLNGIAAGIGDLSGLSQSEEDSAAEDCGSTGRKTPLLVFKAGAGAPRAVPLSLVSRLEEFPAGKIEKAGARSVVQYRGRLMPLVPFDESLSLREDKAQPVLVFSEGERAMGLLVDEIVDIVEEHVEMQLSGEGHGAFLGSAIINGQAMDVIDVGHFLGLARDDWFRVRGARQAASAVRRVLLIDDSHFFRNMLQPMLTASGCEVVSVSSADEALRLRRSGALFDLIVSDIEMPGMDGFAFAEEVRAEDSPWRHVSLIALSSHASPRDRARGVEAGFDDYIAKFDRHALLGAVGRMAGGMQVESEVA